MERILSSRIPTPFASPVLCLTARVLSVLVDRCVTLLTTKIRRFFTKNRVAGLKIQTRASPLLAPMRVFSRQSPNGLLFEWSGTSENDCIITNTVQC
jgi:hypothetical protein